jgi:hypothetical protein
MKRVNVYYDGDLYDEEEPDGEYVYFAEANDLLEAQAAQLQEAREALEYISNLLPDDYSPQSIEGMAGRRARSFLAKS